MVLVIFQTKNPKRRVSYPSAPPSCHSKLLHRPQYSFPRSLQELKLIIFTPNELLFTVSQLVIMRRASQIQKNQHLPLVCIFHLISRKNTTTGPYYQKIYENFFPGFIQKLPKHCTLGSMTGFMLANR